MVDWSQKYMPVRVQEVVGQKAAVAEVTGFIKNYRPGDRPILLHGPPGSGKNAVVSAVSSELGLELIEVNASDKRNAEMVRNTIGSATRQASLFRKGKVILVDEVDGLYGVQDRGAVPELNRIISESQFPMVLTANNPWDKKLSSLRSHVRMVQLRRPTAGDIVEVLKRVCEAEKIGYDLVVLKRVAELSKGDVRAAINDLQTIASGRKKVTLEDAGSVDMRDKDSSIFELLSDIFRNPSVDPSVFDTHDKPIEDVIPWIAENIPREMGSPSETAAAYEALSRADVMLGRIRRQQYWRFAYYASIFASSGVSAARRSPARGFVRYQSPSRIMKLWRTKSLRSRVEPIKKKISAHCHCSTRVAHSYLFLLKAILKGGGEVMGIELTDQELQTVTSS